MGKLDFLLVLPVGILCMKIWEITNPIYEEEKTNPRMI